MDGLKRQSQAVMGKAETVKNSILEHIRSENLPSGTKMSSERELAGEFGVHRLTVRKAIKELCALGVLEQKHGKGTYVGANPPSNYTRSELDDDSLAPAGSFFSCSRNITLSFAIDDKLPEQKAAWLEIFRSFEESAGDIKVEPIFDAFRDYVTDLSEIDVYILTPHFLTGSKGSFYDAGVPIPSNLLDRTQLDVEIPIVKSQNMSFQKKWGDSLNSATNENQESRSSTTHAISDTWLLPIFAQFPVVLLNADLFSEKELCQWHSHMSLDELESWLKRYGDKEKQLPLLPFLQTPLHHFCRYSDKLRAGDDVSKVLKGGQCERLISIMIDTLKPFILNKSLNLSRLYEKFFDGELAMLEIFSNILPYAIARMRETNSEVRASFGGLSDNGSPQIMLRSLMTGRNAENKREAAIFANFLSSRKGQELIAKTGLGLPVYETDFMELYCEKVSINPSELQTELIRAKTLFEPSIFNGSQNQIVAEQIHKQCLDLQTSKETLATINSKLAFNPQN